MSGELFRVLEYIPGVTPKGVGHEILEIGNVGKHRVFLWWVTFEDFITNMTFIRVSGTSSQMSRNGVGESVTEWVS